MRGVLIMYDSKKPLAVASLCFNSSHCVSLNLFKQVASVLYQSDQSPTVNDRRYIVAKFVQTCLQ